MMAIAALLCVAALFPYSTALAESGNVGTNANDPVWIFAQTLPTGINRIETDLNTIADIDGVDERVNVDIAILDTGVNMNHPDLNVVGGTSCVSAEPTPEDGHGHGSHVSGTAAGLDNGIGVVGVAPGARIWAVKVLNSAGSGTFQQVACGVDWVTARAGQIDVISMSLGGSGADDGNCGFTNGDVLHQAVCRAVNQGIVVVVAAGNSAADARNFVPAAYDEVITVSAIADFDGTHGGQGSQTCRADQDDTLADFSNFGADVDIAAPGVCIFSTYKNGGYATFSGTSMATPHVSGAAGIAIFLDGKPTNKAGTVAIKNHLVSLGAPQGSLKGFTGDRDSTPEPLLIIEDLEGPPPPPFDFTISVDPTSGTIYPGESVTAKVTATLKSGVRQTVTFGASGFPSGASRSFSPASCLLTCSTTMTITTTREAPPGTYEITVKGFVGTMRRTATYTLNIQTPPFHFTISVDPTSGTIYPGESVTATVTATLKSGSPQTVTFGASGFPSGASRSFSPASCLLTCSTTMTITTTQDAPPGTYEITVKGFVGTLRRTAMYSLVILPGNLNAGAPLFEPPNSVSLLSSPWSTPSFTSVPVLDTPRITTILSPLIHREFLGARQLKE